MGSAQWLFASSSRAATLDMLSRQTEMAMDFHYCRPCPACDIWTTDDFQLLESADPDIQPVHAQATFINNSRQCSCGVRYCFWCGVTNPREEEFCKHGRHKCDYKLIGDGCEWIYNGSLYGIVCHECDEYWLDPLQRESELDQLEDNSWDGQFDRDGQKHSYGGRKNVVCGKGTKSRQAKKAENNNNRPRTLATTTPGTMPNAPRPSGL
jgi:hypothetical protein